MCVCVCVSVCVGVCVGKHITRLLLPPAAPLHFYTRTQTSISDLEVEYTEEEGHMYTFKYPIFADSSSSSSSIEEEFIPVSTTRPETILGDAALCVHPQDLRYKHLVGMHAIVPGTGGR